MFSGESFADGMESSVPLTPEVQGGVDMVPYEASSRVQKFSRSNTDEAQTGFVVERPWLAQGESNNSL